MSCNTIVRIALFDWEVTTKIKNSRDQNFSLFSKKFCVKTLVCKPVQKRKGSQFLKSTYEGILRKYVIIIRNNRNILQKITNPTNNIFFHKIMRQKPTCTKLDGILTGSVTFQCCGISAFKEHAWVEQKLPYKEHIYKTGMIVNCHKSVQINGSFVFPLWK